MVLGIFKARSHLLYRQDRRTNAPDFQDAQMVVVEQGCIAEAVLDTVNGTFDSITKIVVFFSLQTGCLRKECQMNYSTLTKGS